MTTGYDWLTLHGDGANPDTQQDLLLHLERMDVGRSQRMGVRALQRCHFQELLRQRRLQRQTTVERVSERRMQLRGQGRERWRAAPSATREHVRIACPHLFQQASEARSGSEASSGEPAVAPHANTVKRKEVPTPAVGSAAAQPRALTPSPPPPAARSAPQQVLSDLLKRKSHVMSEGDDECRYANRGNTYGAPMVHESSHRVPARGGEDRNPFQTAGAKLQHDRLSGKSHDDDDRSDRFDRNQRGPRGLSRQTPHSGGYHPVNPHLLLGGGSRRDGDGYDAIEDDGCSAIRKPFVSPLGPREPDQSHGRRKPGGKSGPPPEEDENIDPRLRSCDPDLITKIEMEIVDSSDPVTFDDIAGLQFAKRCVNELVIWPMARPDIFTGLRSLPKGLLLFGPPGTGKTLIGKAIANQSGATFFSISASSLTSKWIGEGEKLVRTLFAVAAVKQPSVIFIDEIDSLLTQRSSEENEASRRMKTEFLVQLDGAGTKEKDVILVVGATNRPQELDEAARRRFVKRLYIPLPSFEARFVLINRLLMNNKCDLTEDDKNTITEKTKGYSGADVRALCTEAAMGPIRSCTDIRTMDASSVRPINVDDFEAALRGVRSSVAAKDLDFYRQWNDEFGSFAFEGATT